jgi:hypothetical protein
MTYLLWVIVVVVYTFGYRFAMNKFSKPVVPTRVEPTVVTPLNKNVVKYPSNHIRSVSNVTHIKKVMYEKEQKADLRSQYNTWKENVKLVDEYFNRGQNLQMKSG